MAGWRMERVERIRGERRAHHGFRRKVGRHEASVGSSLDPGKQPEGDCPQRAGMRMKLLALFVVLGALPRTGHCVRPAKQAAFRSRSTSDTGGLSVSAPRSVRRSASSTETATRLPFPRTWTTTAMTPVAPRCHWMRWRAAAAWAARWIAIWRKDPWRPACARPTASQKAACLITTRMDVGKGAGRQRRHQIHGVPSAQMKDRLVELET